MKKNYFIKNVEKMISPIDVGTLHFMQTYANKIPKNLQYKFIDAGSKKNPYMGFVVEPYSLFLGYEIKDLEWAKSLIPDNYELIKTKIFEDDEPKYYCIFGSFNVHTSAFFGTRMEFYIIALNKETNLTSWVIVDYHTNTVSFDSLNGLIAGNTKECVFTTNYNGEVIVDIKGDKDNKELVLTSNVTNGKTSFLDKKLWIEGNLSITYGKNNKDDDGKAFGVMFNKDEVLKAIKIDVNDVLIESNTWFSGLFEDKPSSIACFPFAQHFISDSPGHYSNIKTEEELDKFVENIDFNKIPPYSSKGFKKAFLIGQLISFLITITLIILLILK